MDNCLLVAVLSGVCNLKRLLRESLFIQGETTMEEQKQPKPFI